MKNIIFDKDTIIRTVILVITLINQALTMFGKNPLPFSEAEIYEVLTLLATVGASIWAWWKNNDFTPEAKAGTALMKELKVNKEDGLGE